MCDAPPDLLKIKNVQPLLDRFGEWPCFHDSKIESIHLSTGDTENDVLPFLEIKIVLVDFVECDYNEILKEIGEKESDVYDGKKGWHIVDNCIVTFKFTDVLVEYIKDFTYDNELEELIIKEIEPTQHNGHRFEIETPDGPSGVFFLHTKFKCREIEIVNLELLSTKR